MAPRLQHDYARIIADAGNHASVAQLAKAHGVNPSTLTNYLHRNPEDYARVEKAIGAPARVAKGGESPGISVNAQGETTVVSEVVRGELSDVKDAEAWLRDRWGFGDEWIVGSVTGNSWEGPGGEGTLVTYSQVKGTFRKIIDFGLLSPAAHVPALVRPRKVSRTTRREQTWIVEIDHQAPYFDEGLDAATTAMTADLQPDGHVFGGDLLDLPTISKHPDHPAAMATPQECVDAGYGILRRRAEAAPNALRKLIRGNHDWRLEGEQLIRSERMHGLAPAGELEAALSLKRLLHCDALGVEHVTDPRGWQHDEVEIVPGPYGLVVRHGWLTGAKTAEKSVRKRGRSIIVGHTHQPEHAWIWDPSMEVHRQGVVAGAMSLARNVRFPHFAVLEGWAQGPVVVTVRSDRDFVIEQTHWSDGQLYWRDRSWKPR